MDNSQLLDILAASLAIAVLVGSSVLMLTMMRRSS